MSIKIEKTENANELKLSFEIEAEKFDNAIKKVYEQSAKYFNIPGFRKGKAPMAIVEKTYGPSIFYEDAFNEVVPEIYEKELKVNNIEAVSNPDLDIEQMEKGQDLKFTAIVQIKPEVKLGKYKGIEIKKIEYNVSDDDVEHELGHMLERNARVVTVEDREVQKGDILLNITGDSVARACMMEDVFLPARVNQHVAIVRGEKNKALNRYLLYHLQLIKEKLLQLASAGATRNALTKGMIEQFPLTSLSIGVVVADVGRFGNILEIGEIGAQVKHAAKSVMGSSYAVDRRK